MTLPISMVLKNHPNIALRRVQPHAGNPLVQYPVLSTLWTPALTALAKEAIQEAFDSHRTLDYGAIYLVLDKNHCNKVVGITGYLPWPSSADGLIERAGLRWHGLLPSYRGNGLSLEIINTMREYAAYQYPHAQHFVEFMPVDEDHKDVARYFEAAGFKKWGGPEAIEWSDVAWQEYVCNIREPLRYHPTPVDNPSP